MDEKTEPLRVTELFSCRARTHPTTVGLQNFISIASFYSHGLTSSIMIEVIFPGGSLESQRP
jgi:hypothetical protein